MTGPSSDNPKLRRGTISSASVPNTPQSRQQRSRHVQSRLTIIPLPSSPVRQPRRSSRTSFSATSFSQCQPAHDLRIYSHPLSPQEVYDLAVSSLQMPHPTPAWKETVNPANINSVGRSVTQPGPKQRFIQCTNDLHLPFVDRQTEVASLLQHPKNASILTLIELLFTDEKQRSDFRRLLCGTAREDSDDIRWISTIRTILKPRSEILWARLKTILGVPPELDDDDNELLKNIGDLPAAPADVTARLMLPNQSRSTTHRLAGTSQSRSPDSAKPIIEEAESTPNDDSASEQEKEPNPRFVEVEAAALCFQTAPLFAPGSSLIANEAHSKPKIDAINDRYHQHRRRSFNKGHGGYHDGTSSPSQELDISSLSSASNGSSRNDRLSSLRRPSSRRRSTKSLHPVTAERAKSPLSGPPLTGADSSFSRKESVDKKNEAEGEGHESDVSDGSSISFEGGRSSGLEEGSHIMTGTGDVVEPRKPSLRPGKKSDIPSRDIPLPIEPSSGSAANRDGNEMETDSDRSGRHAGIPSFRITPHSGPSSVSGFRSPSLSTASLSENVSDLSLHSIPEPRRGPHFPASFSKSPILRKPRPVSRQTPSQSVSEPPATSAMAQGRADHSRSHTISAFPTNPPRADSRPGTYPPPPPPPTPEAPRTPQFSAYPSSGAPSPRDILNLSATGNRPRRASSRSCKVFQGVCEQPEDEDEKEASKSCVEVEGLKDGVRGSVNPLLQLEQQTSDS